jgi:ribonuclease-3
VYLDGGPDPARNILARYAMPDDDALSEMAGAGPPHDYRAELERLARDRNLPKPEYSLVGETGPGHARRFTVRVRAGKEVEASGEGSSKKIAAHHAASEACRLVRGD